MAVAEGNMMICMLVGGLEHDFYFPQYMGSSFPLSLLIFQSG
jgi:hypothetical protein